MSRKFRPGRLLLAGCLAAPLCFGFSTLVVDANQRSFERGQLVGQCQVVVNLVAAKKRADPSWSPPPGDLMQRCRIALANVREGS